MILLIMYLACGDDVDKELSQNETTSVEPNAIEPSQEPGQEETSIPCEVSVMRMDPTDQTMGHYFRDPISAILMGVDDSATIVIQDPSGNEMAGELSIEEVEMAVDLESTNPDDLESLPRSVISFVPDALRSNTKYSIQVSYCQDTVNEEFEFTTSEFGNPVISSLVDKTFPMTLQEGTWVNPEGLGPILSALLQNSILFGVLDETEEELAIRLGVSMDGVYNQDYCFPTITDEMPPFVYNNPSFEMGPANVGVVISGFFITIENFYISGAVTEDGGRWGNGIMKGTFDARDLDLALPLSMGEICSVVESFGSACGPCLDGISMCFDVDVQDLGGSLISDPLECVQYMECHPQCQDNGCSNPDMGVCYESEQGH